MASMDDRRQDLPAEVAARSGRAAPVVIPLVAAFAFGAIDQLVPWAAAKSSNPSLSLFAVQVSKMSAPWLLVPFLAGAWQASRLRAATLGLAVTWLAVLAYVLMIVSPMEGVHLTPRTFAFSLASQWPWFAGGLITGPLYGWLGHLWRTRRSALPALIAALPVLLEPAALWLSSRIGLGGTGVFFFQWPYQHGAVAAEFAELAVGLLLTYGAAKVIAGGRAPAALQ